jgi:hypothetical protein
MKGALLVPKRPNFQILICLYKFRVKLLMNIITRTVQGKTSYSLRTLRKKVKTLIMRTISWCILRRLMTCNWKSWVSQRGPYKSNDTKSDHQSSMNPLHHTLQALKRSLMIISGDPNQRGLKGYQSQKIKLMKTVPDVSRSILPMIW